MPPPTTTHHQPKYIHHHLPPSTTTHHQPKYIYHHTQPPKNGPAPSKSQNILIYCITSFWHCFNSFFFYEMQYSFPWWRFCVMKFWSVCFSNSKFLLHFTIFKFFKLMFQEFKLTRFKSWLQYFICFINKIVMLTYYQESKQPKKTDHYIYWIMCRIPPGACCYASTVNFNVEQS